MKEQNVGIDLPFQQTSAHSASALVDERSESDADLRRERELVDKSVYGIQHDGAVAPSVRRAMRELRGRLRQQRQVTDRERTDARRATDAAFEDDQRTSTHDLTRAEDALESAEQTLHLDRLDAHRGLWAVLAELDVIATSVQAIRLRTVDLPLEQEVFELAGAIEIASDRVLEIVGNLLDPEDNRGRYHEIGGSG